MIQVVTTPSPFELQREIMRRAAGPTVRELLSSCGVTDVALWSVTLNGVILDHEHLDHIRPSDSAVLTAIKRPGEGITIGAILAQIAVRAVVVYGLSLLARALAPPAPGAPGELKGGRRTSVMGDANRSLEYASISGVLGRHRVYPPYAAQPYNTVGPAKPDDDDSEQVLYGHYLFDLGKGPVDVTAMKIGDDSIFADSGFVYAAKTLLKGDGRRFDSVTVEFVQGFDADASYGFSLFDANITQKSIEMPLKAKKGWQDARRTPQNVTGFDVIISFPGGLFAVTDTGKYKKARVKCKVQYASVTADNLSDDRNWTNGPVFTVSHKTRSTIHRSKGVSGLAEGQYFVRMRRLTSDHTTDPSISDSVVWSSIIGHQTGQPVVETGMALIAVKAKLSNQFPNGIDGYNLIATSIVNDYLPGIGWDDPRTGGVYDDTVWSASRRPAALFRHVLQGKANKRPVADSRIDLESLEEWYVETAEQQLEYNSIIRAGAERNVYDVLQEICAAGKASFSVIDGKFTVVRDLPLGGMGRQSGKILTVVKSGSDTTGVTVNQPCLMQSGKSYAIRYQTANGWQYHDIDTSVVVGGTKALTFTTPIDALDDPPSVADVFSFGYSGAPVQLFTPRNSWGFAVDKQLTLQPEGLQVGYVSRGKIQTDGLYPETYMDDDIIVAAEGFTAATAEVLDRLDLPGVVGETQAKILGDYHLAVVKYRPTEYTLSVDWESLNIRRGDWARVQHDAILSGITSGRITVVTTDGGGNVTALTVDEPCTMELGKIYGLTIHNADPLRSSLGSPVRVVAVAGAQTSLTMVIAIPAANAPSAGDLFAFSELTSQIGDYRVQNVSRGSEFSAELTLLDAAELTIAQLHMESLSLTARPTSDTALQPDISSPVTMPGNTIDEPDPPVISGSQGYIADGDDDSEGTTTTVNMLPGRRNGMTVIIQPPKRKKRRKRRRRRRRA